MSYLICEALRPLTGRANLLRGAMVPERLAPGHRITHPDILEARFEARNAWLTTHECEYMCPFADRLQATRYHGELATESAAMLNAVEALQHGAAK